MGANVSSDPPQLSVVLKELEELPSSSKNWEDVPIPIDILLVTVKDWEFLSCHFYLDESFNSYYKPLGTVYFGFIGKSSGPLKIALIKCDMGSSGPGGSLVVVKNAVAVLKPKAVFCVGFCGGLNCKKVKLGDVVVSAKLITYDATKVRQDAIIDRGDRVPLKRDLKNLIRHVADGWKAPLKDPRALKVTVHRDGVFLSGPELVNNNERRKQLTTRYKDAIAIEMEGQGVFAAAHDLDIEWIVIKGVSDFADGTKSDTASWRKFASVMAASLVAHMLRNSRVFQDWSHCSGPLAVEQGPTGKKKSAPSTAEGHSKEHDIPTELNAQSPDNEEAVQNVQKNVQEASLLDNSCTSKTKEKMTCDVGHAGVKQNGSQVNTRLSSSVKGIPTRVLSRVCVILNVKRDVKFDDFRMLAEKVGLDRDKTNFIEQLRNPTEEILKTWSSKSEATVGKLIEFLKEKDFERMDVVTVLEDWIEGKQSE